VIVISNVASHHLIQNTISLHKSFIFACHKLLTNAVYSNQCHGVFAFSDSFNMPMSQSKVVFRRWFVCDEIIYYTIKCSFVYPPTVLRQFQRGCLLKSDMSCGDLYFRAAPLGVHVCFRRHKSCWWEKSSQQNALSQCVCVWGIPRNLAPFCS